jgi:nucleoside diphosphate kinase
MNKRFQDIFEIEEYNLFLEGVQNISRKFSDIIGVLGVGSLFQPTIIPDGFFIPRYNNVRGIAYEKIRNPGRRKLAIREGTDLDLWICTKDTDESRSAQTKVELGAIALISELVSGTLKWGSQQWHNKKQAIFNKYYKNQELYPNDFISLNNNSEPWMANQFKKMLEDYLIENIPSFIEKVNANFSKKIPGDFLEIRAFPESLFHLRPDDAMMHNMQEDRMPFPRIANDQWISTEHSSFVLYSTDEVSIYPFKEKGRILGLYIDDFLKVDDSGNTGVSYGSLVIKPDAIKKKQLDIILTKIYSGISNIGGRISAQKTLKSVTDTEVEIMYPLLTGRELQEVKDYLVGNKMIIFIIEARVTASEMFKFISKIKGPRLIDRSYERLMEGRILNGSIRDLLPVPGEESQYKAIIPKIVAKKANSSIRFSDEDYKYYAQNLVHSPDNEIELNGLFQLAGFSPKKM